MHVLLYKYPTRRYIITYNAGVGLPRLIGKDVSALACKNEGQETKHVDGLGLRI